MSFNILLVEDELENAKGLAFLIRKYDPECSVLKIAANGEEGLLFAEKLHPDIIITDIRMPKIDGLEMSRILREKNNDAIIIILSGYADFEYAKLAIRYDVSDFLTKPVDEDELHATILKTENLIMSRKGKEQSISAMSARISEYDLQEFLKGNMDKLSSAVQFLDSVANGSEIRYYTGIIMEINEEIPNPSVERSLADNAFGEWILFSDRLGDGKTLYVIGSRESYSVSLLKHRISALEIDFFMGIGQSYTRIQDLPESYSQARIALNYRILSSSRIIEYSSIGTIQNNSTLISQSDLEKIEESIDRFDTNGIQIAVRSIFSRILEETNLSLGDLQRLSLDIVLLGLKKVPIAQIQMNSYLGKNLFTLRNIEKFQTIEQLENWIVNILNSMNEIMLRDNSQDQRDVISQAKEYIRKNYNKKILLNELADRLYLNPSYFSQLFKKKTGMTYQSYLTEYRIERAKKLLEETDLRIYEICELVGYTDSKHFNQLFERSVEMTPGEYRHQFRKEHQNG